MQMDHCMSSFSWDEFLNRAYRVCKILNFPLTNLGEPCNPDHLPLQQVLS